VCRPVSRTSAGKRRVNYRVGASGPRMEGSVASHPLLQKATPEDMGHTSWTCCSTPLPIIPSAFRNG
jgi:hypothetical protein